MVGQTKTLEELVANVVGGAVSHVGLRDPAGVVRHLRLWAAMAQGKGHRAEAARARELAAAISVQLRMQRERERDDAARRRRPRYRLVDDDE